MDKAQILDGRKQSEGLATAVLFYLCLLFVEFLFKHLNIIILLYSWIQIKLTPITIVFM